MPAITALNVNLKLLQAFITVAEHQSFREAADKSLRSQSAVSAQIKKLENQLGVVLFHRTTRSVVLTDEGRMLFESAKRAMQEVEHSLRTIEELKELRRGHVTISCAPTVAAWPLPRILSLFEQDHPHVSVHIREVPSQSILATVSNGEVDFAIAQTIPAEPELYTEPLLDDPVYALMRRDFLHDAKGREKISLRELSELPLLQFAPVTAMRRITEAAMSEQKLITHSKYDCINALTLIAMAEEGLGAAVLPKAVLRFADTDTTVALKLVEPELTRQVSLITLRGRVLSPSAARLAQLIREQIV